MPANFITSFEVVRKMKAKDDQSAQDNNELLRLAKKHLVGARKASSNYGFKQQRSKHQLKKEVENAGVLIQYPLNFMKNEWFDDTCKKGNLKNMAIEWLSPEAARIETTCRASGVHPVCKNIDLSETLQFQIMKECEQFIETKRKRIAKRRGNPKFKFTRAQLDKHKNECTQKSTVKYCNESVKCKAEIAKYFSPEEKERLDTCKNEFVAHLNSFVDPVRIEEFKTTFSSFGIVDTNQGEFSEGKCRDSKDNMCTKVKPYYKLMKENAPKILKKLTEKGDC